MGCQSFEGEGRKCIIVSLRLDTEGKTVKYKVTGNNMRNKQISLSLGSRVLTPVLSYLALTCSA